MGHGELQVYYNKQSDIVAVRTAAQLTRTTIDFTADPSLSPGHEILAPFVSQVLLQLCLACR